MKDVTSGIVWAHRGRNRIAPENTMAAFVSALSAGDAGIELDVNMSSDGILVVIHDDRVDRTTNGTGSVSSLRYEYLKSLDAGFWFNNQFKGEHIPMLLDVLNEARGSALVNIEIKSSSWRSRIDDGIEIPILKIINESKMLESVLISSFEWRSLRRVRTLNKDIPLGILAGRRHNPIEVTAFAREVDAFSIHPDVRDVVEGIPDVYQQFDGWLFPYTIPDAETASKLLQIGINGFFADLPFNQLSE